MIQRRQPTAAMPDKRDVIRIAAEAGNVFSYPKQRGLLVKIGKVCGHLIAVKGRHIAEAADAVSDRDRYHTLLRKIGAGIDRHGPAAFTAAMEEYGNGLFPVEVVCPDIDDKGVFRLHILQRQKFRPHHVMLHKAVGPQGISVLRKA